MQREEIFAKDESFRYSLLSRMQQDCKYYLGLGNRDEMYLWAHGVKDHIEIMRQLYDSFPEGKKPSWLPKEELESYARQMLETEDSEEINGFMVGFWYDCYFCNWYVEAKSGDEAKKIVESRINVAKEYQFSHVIQVDKR